MNVKLFKILFVLIFLLGVFLRLYNISVIPPGVNQDEASIGYTAYSLLKTGKDEYGMPFPLSFQSFGDWKLPVYIYLTVPFVKAFGLSEIAVRLPSVIFGSATLILAYFLAKYLFKDRRLALLSMGFLAISPWHLHLSRVESESNVAVFLITLSTILLFKSFEKRKWLIVPAALGFALTYYTYAGNYIFTSLFLFVILFLYGKKIFSNKFFKIALFSFLVLFIFIGFQTIFSANRTKLSGISIFSDSGILTRRIDYSRSDHGYSLVGEILHNKLTFGIERFAQNYLNSFSAEFLFFKGGDDKAHNIADFGNMYFMEAPILLLGFISLYAQRKKTEAKLLIFWLLISPLAGAITKNAPHTNRMFAIFPALSIALALGFYEFLNYFKNPNYIKKFILSAFLGLFFINIVFYFDRYYVHFPKNEGEYWGGPYRQILSKINDEKYKDRRVVFAVPEVPHYIFLLFYSKYDPQTYQKTVIRYPPTEDKFVHVKKFDRYEFRDIVWSVDLNYKTKSLLIEFSKDIPPLIKNEDYAKIGRAHV